MLIPLAAALLAPAVQKPPAPPVGKVRLPPLSYTVERSGPADGPHPKRSDTITVRYRLTLLDGTEVDSTPADGPPAQFPLNRLIPAWQVLVQLMRPGDAWTFFVPPEYGYGAVARSDKLPANSFLVFRVELLATEAAAD
jgi:peptidylprolyl isomerase/FKBP-type peptidyl-prolyl cis-trans isomerase FklB